MPHKKTKRSKAQSGGWFWEQSDPVFGKSKKWLATQAGYIDDDLKQSKRLSKPVGELVYGRRRPHGHRHGCGKPFMNPNAASFGRNPILISYIYNLAQYYKLNKKAKARRSKGIATRCNG